MPCTRALRKPKACHKTKHNKNATKKRKEEGFPRKNGTKQVPRGRCVCVKQKGLNKAGAARQRKGFPINMLGVAAKNGVRIKYRYTVSALTDRVPPTQRSGGSGDWEVGVGGCGGRGGGESRAKVTLKAGQKRQARGEQQPGIPRYTTIRSSHTTRRQRRPERHLVPSEKNTKQTPRKTHTHTKAARGVTSYHSTEAP